MTYHRLICSNPPKNPFSPQWKTNFYTRDIEDKKFLEELKKYLISQKNIILNKYKKPEVFNNSSLPEFMTRYPTYNLFVHGENISCIDKLREIIISYYDDFLSMVFPKYNCDPYITCWYTYLKNGEFIERHKHDQFTGYLSGNIIVDCTDSSTVYEVPYEQGTYTLKNIPGRFTMFESHIPHWTTEHVGNIPRLSVAFDLKVNLDKCPDEARYRYIKLYK
jgi:hypothetical protein